MVVINFWIQKRLLSIYQSLEKTHWRTLIQFNWHADFHLDQMESLKVVKICCNLWLWKLLNRYLAGSGIVDISEHCDKSMSNDLFKSRWRQNICTEFTEIGGSSHETKNQAINWWWAWQLLLLMINPKIICCKKKCCWHCVIGSKAKCNNPLTWWGLWCGLSISLKFDLWSSPCIWRGLA